MHLPPLCHPKYTSIQAQQEEGKALETFVQNVMLRYVYKRSWEGRKGGGCGVVDA